MGNDNVHSGNFYDGVARWKTALLYAINVIVMTFTVFLFLLSDSTVFGSNMVFLITMFPSQQYNPTFVLLTLLLTNIFNYKHSIDNSTYCGNAIYSIVLFVMCVSYGALYFDSLRNEAAVGVKKKKSGGGGSGGGDLFRLSSRIPSPFRTYFIYVKFFMIFLMDWFYQPDARDSWYLFSCFVLFIGNHSPIQGRYLIPFLGLVIGDFFRPVSHWIWYTCFCIVTAVVDAWLLK